MLEDFQQWLWVDVEEECQQGDGDQYDVVGVLVLVEWCVVLVDVGFDQEQGDYDLQVVVQVDGVVQYQGVDQLLQV